jgi:hypothetical protein
MLVVATLQLGLAQVVEARGHAVTPHVFPPNSVPYGHTYGEWSAIAWQEGILGAVWDPTACSFGQIGQVQLLAATAGGPAVFECDVPAGSAFLMPVVTVAFVCPYDCGPGTPVPSGTVEELRAVAAATMDATSVLECDIDGVPVRDLWNYRVQSPVFAGELVAGSIFNVLLPDLYSPGPYGPAVADGWWVLVSPLPVGDHVIHFRAVVGDFETESTHYITVVPAVPGKSAEALALDPATWGAIKSVYR